MKANLPAEADPDASNINSEVFVSEGDVVKELPSRDEYTVEKIGLEVELQPVNGGRPVYWDARRFRDEAHCKFVPA